MSMHHAMGMVLESEELPLLRRDPLAAVFTATANRAQAETDWRLALQEASKTHSLRKIAALAGVSSSRVHQIVSKP